MQLQSLRLNKLGISSFMADTENFIGSWKLVSFHNIDSDNNVNYPFGKEAKGMIYYHDSGHMGVNIMSEGRKNFESGDMFVATPEEMQTAIRYISYSGKFRVEGDKVIHQIEVSFFPNWVGAEQERFYEFKESQLTLSTRPMKFGGKKVVSKLLWEKL